MLLVAFDRHRDQLGWGLDTGVADNESSKIEINLIYRSVTMGSAVSKHKRRFPIAPARDIPPGTRRIVQIQNRSVGIYNVNGDYYALRNLCPHQGAPLCLGSVTGTTLPSRPGEYRFGRKGEIVRCPWHGWEFDITTGRSIFNPQRVRVKTYDVVVESEGPKGSEKGGETQDKRPSVETYEVGVESGWVVLYLD